MSYGTSVLMSSCTCRHVRTLVLDLDDTLVHSDWTRGRGWRTFKRPGAEDFLRQVRFPKVPPAPHVRHALAPMSPLLLPFSCPLFTALS